MENGEFEKKRWYRAWWGMALLGAGGLVLAGLIIFGSLTAWYWWQINHGQGKILTQQFSGSFTPIADRLKAPAIIDRSVLEISDAPHLGMSKAPVTIVEFADFKCPNCRLAAPILRQVAQKYGNKVKIIFRNFPVESTHPGASRLAQLGYCADRQGRFWPMHDLLYNEQDNLAPALSQSDIKQLTDKVSLDFKQFWDCLVSPASTVAVNRDYSDGFGAGVGGTPTWFVNGEKVEGVIPLEVWSKFLDSVK